MKGYINRKNPPKSGRLFCWGGNVALDNPRPLRFPWWKVELKESFESMENDTARPGKEPTCHGLNGSPLPSYYIYIFLVISTWNFQDRNESTGSQDLEIYLMFQWCSQVRYDIQRHCIHMYSQCMMSQGRGVRVVLRCLIRWALTSNKWSGNLCKWP